MRFFLVLLALISAFSLPAQENQSVSLYSEFAKSVYQIRSINKKTGEKSSIGSGFVLLDNHTLATNFHVVSDYINDPEDYSLRYYTADDRFGSLSVVAYDVVHDLAIVRSADDLGKPLTIGELPPKGGRLFSLGNPMDLGFSIVPGNNNGVLIEEDGNVLFSGSLNPGMSGGPTLNTQGQVVGVNVATSGNDISFLVPAKYLRKLIDELSAKSYEVASFDEHTAQQLVAYSKKQIKRTMARQWQKSKIGPFIVPSVQANSKVIRCWDASRKPKSKDLYMESKLNCGNDKRIFVSKRVRAGVINYEFISLSSEKVSSAQFYHTYQEYNSSVLRTNAGEQDVTNFSCQTEFIEVAKQTFKTSICSRVYKEYPGLHDMLFSAALIGHGNSGFIFNLDVVGADFESALSLFKAMLGQMTWRN